MGFFTASRIGHGTSMLTPTADGTPGQAVLTDGNKHLELGDIVRWLGEWQSQTYYKHNMVLDGDWLMIANKETTERAAPQPVGDEKWGYNGTLVPEQATAKKVIFGTRYTAQQGIYLVGYRIDVVAGNRYEVYTVKDPLGVAEITSIIEFTADANGWKEFGLAPTVYPAGAVLDVACIVNEPDPAPTVWVGNWNYITPNNPAVPTAGQIIHSDKEPGSFRVNKTDNASGDRGAELLALTPGDIIDGAGQRWSIQLVTDSGTYVDFNVLPASQGTPDGVSEFSFETVTATPITYGREVDYWLGNPGAAGLLSIDGKYSDIVSDDNAYGVDIKLQDASISLDWDVASSMGTGGGGGSGETTEFFTELLDSPATYVGAAGLRVTVKDDETGLEFVPVSGLFGEAVPTGLVDGGELNIGPGANDIEVIAGSGVIVDSYTDPMAAPTITKLSWPQINEAIVASPIAGTIVYFTIESGGPTEGPVAGTMLGVLNQRTVAPTQAEVRDEIFIGYAIFNGTTWGEVSSPNVINNSVHTLNEYITTLRGPTYMLDGGAITEVIAFKLDRAAGVVWERNRNWHVDPKNPNREAFSAQPSFSWKYVNSDMSIVTAPVNTVNPTIYEDSPGSTGPVTGCTIQRLFVDPRDNYWVLYGQNDWDDWNDAVLNLGTDGTRTVLPELLDGSLLLGYIISEGDRSDWLDDRATFMTIDEAIGRGGGAAGVQQDGSVAEFETVVWSGNGLVHADPRILIGQASPLPVMEITGTDAAAPAMSAKAAAAQTANIAEFKTSDGTVHAKITKAGEFSNVAGAGYGPERFGLAAKASAYAAAFGNLAEAGANSVAFGFDAGGINSSHCVSIGHNAGAGAVGYRGIYIGTSAGAGTSFSYVTVICPYATATAENQIVFGCDYSPRHTMYAGNGVVHATPADWAVKATSGLGVDIYGGTLYVDGGQPTGAGVGGTVTIRTAEAGASSDVLQPLVDTVVIDHTGLNIVKGTLTVSERIDWTYIDDDNAMNCLSYGRQSMTITESGGVIYLEVDGNTPAIDLTWLTSTGDKTLDCTTGPGLGGKARVALTSGTDTVPAKNWIYVTFSGDVATLEASSVFPTGEFGWIGTAILQSVAKTVAKGPLALQRASEDLQRIGGRGRISYLGEKVRLGLGSTWIEGVAATITDDFAGSVTLGTAAGIVYQIHRQTFEAIPDPAEILIENHNTTPYVEITDLAEITELSNGAAWINKRYIGVHIYGYVSSGDSGVDRIYINVPSDQYVSADQAVHDSLGFDVDTVSTELKGGMFHIARAVLYKDQSGVVSLYDQQDTRGTIIGGGGAGGGGGTSQVFPDSAFRVYDNDDVSKEIALEASAISTGTVRTIAMPDHDVDLGNVVKSVAGFTVGDGVNAITAGVKGYVQIPFAGTITKVTVLADQAGSIVVDVWKDIYANYPPTDTESITASAPPTLAAAIKSEDSTLTGWTKAVTAGDCLVFNVDSAATVTKVVVELEIRKA